VLRASHFPVFDIRDRAEQTGGQVRRQRLARSETAWPVTVGQGRLGQCDDVAGSGGDHGRGVARIVEVAVGDHRQPAVFLCQRGQCLIQIGESRCQRTIFSGMDDVDAGVAQSAEDDGSVLFAASPAMVVVRDLSLRYPRLLTSPRASLICSLAESAIPG